MSEDPFLQVLRKKTWFEKLCISLVVNRYSHGSTHDAMANNVRINIQWDQKFFGLFPKREEGNFCTLLHFLLDQVQRRCCCHHICQSIMIIAWGEIVIRIPMTWKRPLIQKEEKGIVEISNKVQNTGHCITVFEKSLKCLIDNLQTLWI